jgi:DNA-binding transcriptional LysR family regulator
MDTLRALSAFVHSVELGSLSGAARALATTQPTISKLVAGLERSLGVRLLRRTATGLSLTEEGQRFHERARRVLEDYGDAVADAREQVQQPQGLLRVSAPVTMGQRHLNAMAVEFLRLYPDIELELVLDDRFVDPREERIDVSLRVGGLLPPDLVARTWAHGRACSWRHRPMWLHVASRASRRTCSCTTTSATQPATTACCCRGRMAR